MALVELTVNGRLRHVEVSGDESLLDVLREQCGVSAARNGCQPMGQCGACLALIDGKPKTTCATPAAGAAGRDVVTLEGVPTEERDLYARAFVAAAAVQCGFCTPGIVLRTKALLDRDPEPSREAIARALDSHLCRCTGYLRIFAAVEAIARARRGGPAPRPGVDGRIGRSLGNVQGMALALGERPFIDDLRLEGILHGAVRLSDHPRARVLRIDTSAARALPGVACVLTAEDVPGHRYYGLLRDDWPGLVAVGEEVRCVGDVLAAVAADDVRIARRAAAAVEVEYEALPPALDPFAAMDDGAPPVHPGRSNVAGRTRLVRGDAGAALAASAHVAEGRWTTQRVEHLFLEPESSVAAPAGDGGLHLFTQGQGIFDDRRQVAAFLGLPEERVLVELVPSGGAFGGKEDVTIQPHAALLALRTGRPVKVTLTREQSIRMHPKRHPITLNYEVGCDADGRLTAVRARMVGDTGAYASVGAKVLERAAGHACGPYRVAHVDVESLAVHTNNPPSGAMRGFGANQAAFALEGCLDLLAERVGLDGWEVRRRNALEVGDRFATGQLLTASVGLVRTLEAVRPAWEAARAAGRAVGIACGVKNSGIGNGAPEWGRARLVVESARRVLVYNGFSEMGQGLFTVLVQCAAEVTGLPASTFEARVDGRFPLQCGQTTGSRATLLAGRAVAMAAERLGAAQRQAGGLEPLVGSVYEGEVHIDDTTPPGYVGEHVKTHTAFGWATQVCVLDEAGRVERIVAAHDVGRAINPDLCAAQIEGAVHMGLGHALTEELPCRDGMPVTFAPRELGVLRARDMPAVEVHLVEDPEPEGPFGAKGVGEAGLVPTAAAVAGALAAFDGVRRTTLPMKDSPAARAMSVGRIKATDRERWH